MLRADQSYANPKISVGPLLTCCLLVSFSFVKLAVAASAADLDLLPSNGSESHARSESSLASELLGVAAECPIGAGGTQQSAGGEGAEPESSSCCTPGSATSSENLDSARCRDAREIIQKSQRFRILAGDYHERSLQLNKDATILIAQAKKAESAARKLQGSVREQGAASGPHKLNAQQYAIDVKQYSLRVKEFQNHAKLYNAHLAEYDRELQKLQAANQSLRASCSQYADHVTRFHVPGIQPPHVCVAMEWEIRAAAGAAKQLAADQQSTANSERALAQQEARLSAAAKDRSKIELQLLQKANVNDLEQSQGRMLLKEYTELEREYRMIDSARNRLGIKDKK